MSTSAKKKLLEELGIPVKTKAELPPEIQEAGEKLSGIIKKPGVKIKRFAKEQFYVYEDEYLKLVIPNVRLDVYFAFADELGKLNESKSNKDFVDHLATAFWLLHYKPRWPQKWRTPKTRGGKARDFLVQKIPQATLIFTSLLSALNGYYEWVANPKKKPSGADTAAPPKE